MRPPLKVVGTVVDEETGKPVGGRSRCVQGINWGQGQPIALGAEQRPADRHSCRAASSSSRSDTRTPGTPCGSRRTVTCRRSRGRSRTTRSRRCVLEFKLKKGQMIAGAVKSPTGEPVPEAEVIVATASGGAYIHNGEIPAAAGAEHQDRRGREVPNPAADGEVLSRGRPRQGLRGRARRTIAKSADITLEAWAKVTGVAKKGSKPAGGGDGGGQPSRRRRSATSPGCITSSSGPTDQNGRFIDRTGAAGEGVGRAPGQAERAA